MFLRTKQTYGCLASTVSVVDFFGFQAVRHSHQTFITCLMVHFCSTLLCLLILGFVAKKPELRASWLGSTENNGEGKESEKLDYRFLFFSSKACLCELASISNSFQFWTQTLNY